MASKGKPFVGWMLNRHDRAELLRRFPPAYPDVVADHVTLLHGPPLGTPAPSETSGEVVGIADDGEGVQALVVRINGRIERPDGRTYHITWSLDRARGREAVHSNDVIAARAWTPLDAPIRVRLEPQGS